MILGPSPLLAAVTVDWPLPAGVPADVSAELHAWLIDHGGPAYPLGLERLAISDREIMAWSVGPAGGPTDGPHVAPLRCHPSRALLAGLAAAGALHCAAVVIREDLTERWRCSMPVDDQGRHAGNHVDGPAWDAEAEWPNGNPATGEPRHAATAAPTGSVLAALLRGAIATAVDDCDHPDAGGPIYQPERACADCAATAAMAVLAAQLGVAA